MSQSKASVVINRTALGLSVIDIDIFDEYGDRHNNKLKQIIDGLNALPGLTVADVKSVISDQYRIPQGSIEVID